MGLASLKRRLRYGPRARGFSSSPISARDRGAARAAGGGRDLCARRLESGADAADYVEYRLAPAIGGEEELKRWSAFAARRGETSPSALHLDTGMDRLGFEFPRPAAVGDGDAWADERGRFYL